MKITETIHKEKDEYGGDDLIDRGVEVNIVRDNGESDSISFFEGEPEDAYLYRDLNGAYSIFDALVMAYEAGKAGEPLVTERLVEGDDE